jgi:hypothetical protein
MLVIIRIFVLANTTTLRIRRRRGRREEGR